MWNAYFEKSPSGTGLRGFFKLSPDFSYDKTVYYINNRKHGLEVYLPGTTNRFVTVTGDMYRAGEIARDDEALSSVLDTFMKRTTRLTNSTIEPASYLDDNGVLAHASASESGDKFKALYEGNWEELYDSQSDADMALVSMLAFWCGNVEEQIDRIFRTSGLMRDKWDRMTGDSTYGQITIRNAVSTNTAIYMPIKSDAVYDFDTIDDDDPEYRKGTADFKPDLSQLTTTLSDMQPHTNPRYQRDEIGIGNIFADYYKPIARFNRNRGIWYVYDGSVWQPDEGNLAVQELAKMLADQLYTFALEIHDEDTQKRYSRRMQKLQMRRHRKTMIEDAKSVHPIAHRAFDNNTDLFNCKNGTLNLTTGEFRSHDPRDFITMMSGVTYDPNATCPRWEQFISEVMCNDSDLARYLQKALGYALTGDTSLECLFILYGATSRNGKGTTMETFLKIVGDYGKTSNPEILAAKLGASNSSGPSEEIARLVGARFVNISEPEKKVTFNAALVKRMTGNDTLNARFLHENSFDFRPNFKIFINTNYKPNVNDMVLFESGRLKIIPFKRHFEEQEQDKDLKALFALPENLAGIFNWCLEGCHQFRAERLNDPPAVIEATKAYRDESDRIGQFITDCIEVGEAYEVRTVYAYNRYKEWCEARGYRAESDKNFNASMQRFFEIKKKRPAVPDPAIKSSTTMLLGCRLSANERGETPPEEFAAFS